MEKNQTAWSAAGPTQSWAANLSTTLFLVAKAKFHQRSQGKVSTAGRGLRRNTPSTNSDRLPAFTGLASISCSRHSTREIIYVISCYDASLTQKFGNHSCYTALEGCSLWKAVGYLLLRFAQLIQKHKNFLLMPWKQLQQ